MYTCRHIFVVLIEVWRLMSRRVSPIAHRDSNIEKLPVIVLGRLEYALFKQEMVTLEETWNQGTYSFSDGIWKW